MCHDDDSRPPAPPRSGDVAERGILTLTAGDGTTFSAAYAAPAEPPRVGVVILPDIRGLHPYYVALAERFAEAGAATVAIDYFGRTAGVVEDGGTWAEDFDWRTHVAQTSEAGIDADITAAIGYLRERTSPDLPVITVGFCFGGSHSWRQSGGSLDLAGCAGFYGRPSVVGDAARQAHLPTVMLIAGADAATPVSDQLELAETMRAAGAEGDAGGYHGAPHSFFRRADGGGAHARRDAWGHLLARPDRGAARCPARLLGAGTGRDRKGGAPDDPGPPVARPSGPVVLPSRPGPVGRRARADRCRPAGSRRARAGDGDDRGAIGEARRRSCTRVQLTTEKARGDAPPFDENLGFVAAPGGLKLPPPGLPQAGP